MDKFFECRKFKGKIVDRASLDYSRISHLIGVRLKHLLSEFCGESLAFTSLYLTTSLCKGPLHKSCDPVTSRPQLDG